jgi:hypothetical protein
MQSQINDNYQNSRNDVLVLVTGGLIIGGENQPIGKDSQPQCGVAALAHPAIGLEVESLVHGDPDFGSGDSIRNCRAKITQSSVLDIFLLLSVILLFTYSYKHKTKFPKSIRNQQNIILGMLIIFFIIIIIDNIFNLSIAGPHLRWVSVRSLIGLLIVKCFQNREEQQFLVFLVFSRI